MLLSKTEAAKELAARYARKINTGTRLDLIGILANPFQTNSLTAIRNRLMIESSVVERLALTQDDTLRTIYQIVTLAPGSPELAVRHIKCLLNFEQTGNPFTAGMAHAK